MGLFSQRRPLLRSRAFRMPIRLHSEYSVPSAGRRLARGLGALQRRAARAVNDARVVGALLVIAALALAVEMAASFK
jgi:hypothetical protein